MHQPVAGSVHQTSISEVEKSHGLSDRQIGGSVSHRLLYLEIIEISHSAIRILRVEGIKCHTNTLEGLQLIRRNHLPADIFPVLAIQRIGILQLALIVITPKAKPNHPFIQWFNHLLVGILIIASQCQALIRLHHAQGSVWHVDGTETSLITSFQLRSIQFHRCIRHRTYRTLGK